MDEKRTPKRVIEWKPIGRRISRRQRKTWIEDVAEDIQRTGIRGWRKLCKERTEWKRITEKAKTHSGLQRQLKNNNNNNNNNSCTCLVVKL